MANNYLHYIITQSVPGKKPKDRLKLYVVVSFKGMPQSRKSYVIDGITSPDFRYWDKKTKRFTSGTDTARKNNPVLDAICERCNELLNNSAITTPSEFVDALKENTKGRDEDKKKRETLADFIQILIDEKKQNPSCDYQRYVSLRHNLLGENHKSAKGKVTYFAKPMCKNVAIADTPLADVGNAQLSEFASWVKTVKGGKNYQNLNATLLRVINIAKDRGKNKQEVTYKFRSDAPKKVVVTSDNNKALTLEQFKVIECLSGSVVNPKGHRNRSLQQLYLDTALLMYYTNSRPADVLLFRSDMLTTRKDGVTVLT